MLVVVLKTQERRLLTLGDKSGIESDGQDDGWDETDYANINLGRGGGAGVSADGGAEALERRDAGEAEGGDEGPTGWYTADQSQAKNHAR